MIPSTLPVIAPLTSFGLLRWLPAVPMLFSLVYWRISAELLRRRFRATAPGATEAGLELPPVTFFRPVKPGVPGLRDKAMRLVTSARPGDRVLFGVGNSEDRLECEAACAAAAPGVETLVVLCELCSIPNPKIAKLVVLSKHAGPGHWIVTDSEALCDASFMDSFRAEWRDSGAAALTAGYRFIGAASLPQYLDHLPAVLTLWPGLAVAEWGARRFSGNPGLGLTLGACTGVRCAELAAVGGWEALGSYLAEDHRLGEMLAAGGKPVRLAQCILTLDADHPGETGPIRQSGECVSNSRSLALWLDWMRHQHRVALTYRVCNPGGTLGMALTHGISWALALVIIHPTSPLALLALALTALERIATARRNAQTLAFPMRQSRSEFASAVLLAAVAETGFWLAAWLPFPVRWGARRLRVTGGGRIASISPES